MRQCIKTGHPTQREIATLKVLGYQEKEVSGYIFRETFIITTAAILLGLGVGKLLHMFIISQVVVDGLLLSYKIDWLSFLFTLLISFSTLLVVYLMTLPQTKRIDMIDALKSFE